MIPDILHNRRGVVFIMEIAKKIFSFIACRPDRRRAGVLVLGLALMLGCRSSLDVTVATALPKAVVETTPTIIGVTSLTADGGYRAGQSLSIQVLFSGAVTVTGTPQLTLETGASDAVVNYTSGSGTQALTFIYTVDAGHESADLDYQSASALVLNGGTIKDARGGDVALTLPVPGSSDSLGANKNLLIDTTVPTISAIANQATDLNTPTAAISFTISDSGSIVSCSSSNLSVTSSDSAIIASTSAVWGGTAPNCSAILTPVNNGSGTASVSFTVSDSAGNTATSSFNVTVRNAYVIGQPMSNQNAQILMGLNNTSHSFIAGGRLFVADQNNHRVLVWNSVPTTFGQAPSFVLGQPDLSANTMNNGGVSASSLHSPTCSYSDGTRLYVCDSGNHRVLVWNTMPSVTAQPADFALGQPNLTSNTVNNGGLSGSSLNSPVRVVSDGTRLFVSDYMNHRVLIWNSLPTTMAQSANIALGQPNLTTGTSGTTSSTLNNPVGLAIVGARLFVADAANSRVLGWNALPTSFAQAADFVLGQPGFVTNTANNGGLSATSMSSPRGLHSDGTRLFVADSSNHRVLVWNAVPTTTAQAASFALGQPDLLSGTANNGGISGSTMSSPTGILINGGKLFVNDAGNHRVLVWNTLPTSSGQSADFALGQADFTGATVNVPFKNASYMYRPNHVHSDGTRMVVADSLMNRVLIYNSIPTSSGRAADAVVGQPNFSGSLANNGGISGSSMNQPQGALIVGTKLFVSDTTNHRVLVWNTIPTTNGQPADFVLGQPDLISATANNGGVSGASLRSPRGLYSDGTKLYVADTLNNRVLVWNSIPTTTFQPASFAIGQVDLTSAAFGTTASNLSVPYAVHSNGTNLFVTDQFNHRILIWNAIPTASGVPADVAIGQPNLTSGTANNGGISAATLNLPQGVFSHGSKLYVSDYQNNRVLVWNTIPTTTGQAADAVFGQSNFTSNSANGGGVISASSVSGPGRSFVTGGRLFIPDFANCRVLVIPAP